MTDHNWINNQLQIAKEALERDSDPKSLIGSGQIFLKLGNDRRSAESYLKDVLKEEPFHKEALELLSDICLREIRESVDHEGDPIWTNYYKDLVGVSLTLMNKYPETQPEEERILLTYFFSWYDPYQYFWEAKKNQILSPEKIQIFLTLLKSKKWMEQFKTSKYRDFVLSEGIGVNLKPTKLDDLGGKYVVCVEAKNRIFIYEGRRIAVSDSLGMDYIAVLLDYPRRWFNVFQLKEAAKGVSVEVNREQNEFEIDENITISSSTNSGVALDKQMIKSLKDRKSENLKRLAEGDYHDEAEREELEVEIEKIDAYLKENLDRRKKSKHLDDRKRKESDSVNKAISRAKEDVEILDKEFASHLNFIKFSNGNYCYNPDRMIEWLKL